MKKINDFITNNILLLSFIYAGINILICFILYIMNIRYRAWLFIFTYILFVFSFIIGLLQITIRKFKKKQKYMIPIFIILTIPSIISINIVSILVTVMFEKERVVYIDNQEYVAVAKYFGHFDVYYYDYYNPFLVGLKPRIHADYGDTKYDPLEYPELIESVKYTYYSEKEITQKYKYVTYKKDKDGNIKDTNVIETNPNKEETIYNPNDNYLTPETVPVLYEKKFNDTILRFGRLSHVLGQNQIVVVVRSNDNGKKFYFDENTTIKVSNEAKFVFLNAKQGFAVSKGYISLSNQASELYVTNDSGKTFKESKFNYKNDRVEYLTIEGLPYYEDNKLKIKCSIYDIASSGTGYETKALIFISKDNGVTWNISK